MQTNGETRNEKHARANIQTKNYGKLYCKH